MAHPVIQACIARARRRPFLILFSVLSLSAFIGLDILMWFYMPKNHVVGQSSLELPVNATLQASAARIGQLPDAGDPFSAAARQFHTLPPSIRNPPKHRLLIVVPFRDAAPSHLAQGQGRWANLAQFVPAITNHLRQSGKRPHVDFSILVVVRQWCDSLYSQSTFLILVLFFASSLFVSNAALASPICNVLCLQSSRRSKHKVCFSTRVPC